MSYISFSTSLGNLGVDAQFLGVDAWFLGVDAEEKASFGSGCLSVAP